MPVYEFRCTACGEIFEKMLRFSEADKNPVCPKCASPETKKKISAAALGGSSKNSASSGSGCGSSGSFG
jgi:putative FmdB family regulatory protein